jgi:cytochrome b subunit of formate dehydrogenase
MTIERYRRRFRRFHTAVYVVTLLLLGSGWWLLAGGEGRPTPLARLTGIPDTEIHVWLGWALLVIGVLPLAFAMRSVIGFARETLRYDRGDVGWLLRWPIGVVSGRFRRHEGHFDPGQRLANVAIVGLLALLIGTGIGLVFVHVGPAFAILALVHRLATIAFTAVIAGHILIASGVLPGYRGVWRSMHLGGKLRIETARRIWPGWTERQTALAPPASHPRRRAAARRDAPSGEGKGLPGP